MPKQLETPRQVTRQYLLKCDHLLLPDEVVKFTRLYEAQVGRVLDRWPYGDTSRGNYIWECIIYPMAPTGEKARRSRDWHLLFGILWSVKHVMWCFSADL